MKENFNQESYDLSEAQKNNNINFHRVEARDHFALGKWGENEIVCQLKVLVSRSSKPDLKKGFIIKTGGGARALLRYHVDIDDYDLDLSI